MVCAPQGPGPAGPGPARGPFPGAGQLPRGSSSSASAPRPSRSRPAKPASRPSPRALPQSRPAKLISDREQLVQKLRSFAVGWVRIAADGCGYSFGDMTQVMHACMG